MIYLSIPYRNHEYLAFQVSCAVAARLVKKGEAVFSPIIQSHTISNNVIGLDRSDCDFWMERDLQILEKCDKLYVIMLSGWNEDRRVKTEIQTAMEHKKQIMSLDPLDFVPIQKIEEWREEGKMYPWR